MSFFTDAAFDAFLYFRLGGRNHAANHGERCLYYEIGGNEPPMVKARSELPERINSTRLVVVSDTHERHDCLGPMPAGDIFIHCGDIFMTNRVRSHRGAQTKLRQFDDWLADIPCDRKFVVAGNHDLVMERLGSNDVQSILTNATYLENSGMNVDGLHIWGTPLSSGRSGNSAFQSSEFQEVTEECIRRQAQDKEYRVDVFLSHGPLFQFAELLQPRLHIWGHAHGYHGIRAPGDKLWGRTMSCHSVNASIMDGHYNPTNAVVVVDLPIRAGTI